ncbi:MAG: cytochrome c [Acetobacteraceae bacterium]|nr:cytochrome c [Acetobacteraceae bacterium]
MRTVILTLATALGLGVLGGFTFVWLGVYDVAATTPHWPVTYWIMETVRTRSVKTRAAGIDPPPGMTSEANVIAGTEHYAAHCASCHGAPGVPRGDIAKGLYPRPADLTDVAKRYTPGELFWILKNGIKMSGMPAWSDHSDEELWVTVAFLEKLPAMSQADYAKLVMQSMMGGGRHNHGGNDDAATDKAPASPDGHRH